MNKKKVTEQVKSLKQLPIAITYNDNSPVVVLVVVPPPPICWGKKHSVNTLQRLCDFPDKSRHLQPAAMFMNYSQTEGAPF